MRTISVVTGTSVEDLTTSFLRSLRAENKSARTIETYGDARVLRGRLPRGGGASLARAPYGRDDRHRDRRLGMKYLSTDLWER
jgi:hypothetical protein